MSFLGKQIGFRNEMNLVWFRRSFVAMEDLDEWDHEKRNNFPFRFFFFLIFLELSRQTNKI